MWSRLWRWMNADNTLNDDGVSAPWRLFWVAFLIRLLYMTLSHAYRIRSVEDHFQFAWEAGRIGKSLATGYGYGSPFAIETFGHTGPTAWLPPMYPLLIAAVFKVFGVYTAASAWVLLAINCVFSAATALATWEIAARCFNRRVAVWSGWLWALHPAAMQYSVRWLWEMSISTALFAWVIVLALRMRGVGSDAKDNSEASSRQTRRWLLFGCLWGVIALSTSTLAMFLPACGLWVLIGTWKRPHALRDAALAGVVFIAALTPWMLRNWEVFHAFIPIRGNLGVETFLGNGPGSNGFVMTFDHPNMAPEQLRQYAEMGEVRYVAMRGAMARDYIHAHRRHFLAISLKRAYFFWVGTPSDVAWALEIPRMLNYSFISLAGLMGLALALKRRVVGSGLFFWALLLVPIPYYMVMALPRFRHPLEPLLTVLGVYLFQSATPRSHRETSA
ncbi:glycosyltransferase family 39 protein [Edaphobacter aggregans]|nr:glycosyltransferase family 39 protein [Edaphobacter aggregans]